MVTVTKVELTNSTGNPRSMTVADGTGILKNKVLTLSDPRTVAEVSDVSVSSGYKYGGISSHDKVASDGTTTMAVWTDGVFEVYSSGSITVGNPIKSCGRGYFCAAVINDYASGAVAGYALETTTDGEIFNARLIAN